jgi:membrane protease YdiL (CAAX protease family)
MKLSTRQNLVTASVIFLILGGHFLAKLLSDDDVMAWVYVALYYGGWTFLSLILLLKKSEAGSLLQRPKSIIEYIIPALVAVPLFIWVFIPNRELIKWDIWLALHVFICLVNPWLEEFYWRGLIFKIFQDKPVYSYVMSSLGFGLSHPLIFGVNSPGIGGVPGFIGAFLIGSIWWWCLRRTRSLVGCIITHFLIDVAGMAVYILADKAVLIRMPFG